LENHVHRTPRLGNHGLLNVRIGIITHVNGESVSGLTPEQVIEKLRGPAHSKVDLTIVRKGQDKALEVAVNREIIERHLTQGTLAK
jgi:carboxyl-terminal processing protease